MNRLRRQAGAVLLLFLAAALYFSLSAELTLDWMDEGQIVYPSWRVSQGAIPYSDFHHLYGPSVFFLNGLLFRLFGPDLAVTRLSLVILKSLVAVLVYLCARSLASLPFALLACALTVAIWGTPWWVFNTPYANHYGLALTLAGLLAFTSLREKRFLLGCALAGLCFGVAVTFKQTSGIFAFASLVLFLVWDGTHGDYGAVGRRPPRLVNLGSRAAHLAGLFGVLVFSIAYLWPLNTFWNFALLLTPLALAIGLLAVRELRADRDARVQVHSLAGLFSAAAGMSLPLAAYGACYAGHGGLGALLADTVLDLPRKASWFVPVPFPGLRSLLTMVVALTGLGGVALWRSSAGDRRRRVAAVGCLAACLAAALVALVDVTRTSGLGAYARAMLWHPDIFGALFVLPFAVVWASFRFVFAEPLPASGGDARGEVSQASRRRAVGLFFFYSATSLLFLYPSGDFWHLVMGLPAFLPLLAHRLEHFQEAGGRGEAASGYGHLSSRALVAAVFLVLCAPFVDTLRFARATQPTVAASFERGSGIVGAPPKFEEALDLVEYLDSRPKGDGLLVLCNEQMLYFLAGRPSVLERDEFVLYMVGAGVIEQENASALISERWMIARLKETKPHVVDYAGSPASARFKKQFEEAGGYLDAHFRLVKTFGGYQVFSWAGE